MTQPRQLPRRRGGSKRLGVALVLVATGVLAACVATPASMPSDPAIPQASDAAPSSSQIAPPPTTTGPSEPPVPTTPPGDFAFGETIVIHTERGSTWEITPKRSIDPGDSEARGDCSGVGGSVTPRNGERFAILELDIKNVGVLTTHPMYDLTFGYQPVGGPVADQNSASLAAGPDDIGCVWEFAPGDSASGSVIVAVRASDPKGDWVITGDNFATEYRFR